MDPSICMSCKIFFGNPANENMCSKCFSQAQISKRNEQSIQKLTENVHVIIEESKLTPEPSPDRCTQCQKKLNLFPFKCNCGSYFCSTHRQPEQHNCTFDFKTVGIRKLSEDNPLVQAEKLNRL